MLRIFPFFFFFVYLQLSSGGAFFLNKKFSQPKSINWEDLKPFTSADLIVGYPDSNEVRIIRGSYTLDGRIIIVNNGTLILDTCQFTHRGDMYVFNNGKMIVQSGSYTVLQQYAYTYNALITGNGELNFLNTTISFNGQSWGIGFVDSARYNVQNVTLNNGFTTNSMLGKSRVNIRNTNVAGEFLISDSCYATFNKVGFILIWLYFPDSSRVDLRLPKSDSSYLHHYEIKPNSPGVQGIRYTMIVDSSNNVNWGTIPLKGSDAKIRSSRLRTTGLIIPGSGNQEINGLINNSTYYNYYLPLTDRSYYLDSTRVFTWNIYVVDSVNFTLRNSVFGEAITWGEPHVWIESSICDGTGGYIGAFDSSQMILVRSTVNTQTISGVHAFIIGVESNFRVGAINSTRMSLMVFYNSFYDIRPVANDTSFIFIGLINPPSNATINRIIPITGTAVTINGPFNPVRFLYYRLLYGPGQNPTEWYQIGNIHYAPVENDTLERWNTNGLSVGWYTLRLIVRNTSGDTLDVYRNVYLNIPGVEEEVDSKVISFGVESSNPACRNFAFVYSLPKDVDVKIEFYNVLGRKVKTLFFKNERAGTHRRFWSGDDDQGESAPAGIYYSKFKAGDREIIKKLVLVK